MPLEYKRWSIQLDLAGNVMMLVRGRLGNPSVVPPHNAATASTEARGREAYERRRQLME